MPPLIGGRYLGFIPDSETSLGDGSQHDNLGRPQPRDCGDGFDGNFGTPDLHHPGSAIEQAIDTLRIS
jgi:hypothetical protein